MVAMNIVNLYENYNSYFSADLKTVFELCSKIADKNNFKLYLIGGIVRDLLLGIKNLDVDITVEGDAIEFCRILEREGAARILSIHKPFGTAKAEIQGVKLDFASTRSEVYPKKGHLPKVEKIGCPLELDVIRRDFTINSLALSLNKKDFANLIDYVHGFEDLKSKKLRILHEKSFIDDPTRIIRGLKFAARLGFEIEAGTLKLQREYLKNINYDMGSKRVKSELKQTFDTNSQEAFEKFLDEGIYKLVTKTEVQTPKKNIENILKKYKIKHPWIVYFSIIAVNEDEMFPDRMQLTKVEKEIVLGAKKLLKLSVPDDDFGIYKAFVDFKMESLLVFAILGAEEKKVYRYLDFLKKIKISITGKDLLKLGIKPSRAYGEIFDYVLKQKLKTPEITKLDELLLVKNSL